MANSTCAASHTIKKTIYSVFIFSELKKNSVTIAGRFFSLSVTKHLHCLELSVGILILNDAARFDMGVVVCG